MISVCENGFTELRDKLILLMLLDTGFRASELLALDHVNVTPFTGTLQIIHGEGDKFRMAYLGKKTRLALRYYLKIKGITEGALLISIYGKRLTYTGLPFYWRAEQEKLRWFINPQKVSGACLPLRC